MMRWYVGRGINRMHATADTRAVIFGYLMGQRVMRGVRSL